MQSNYSQWKAAHPLVFIATLLLIGVLLSKQYIHCATEQTSTIAISILLFSTGFIWLLSILKIQNSIILKHYKKKAA